MSKADFTTATETVWPGHVPYEGVARGSQHGGTSMPQEDLDFYPKQNGSH